MWKRYIIIQPAADNKHPRRDDNGDFDSDRRPGFGSGMEKKACVDLELAASSNIQFEAFGLDSRQAEPFPISLRPNPEVTSEDVTCRAPASKGSQD